MCHLLFQCNLLFEYCRTTSFFITRCYVTCYSVEIPASTKAGTVPIVPYREDSPILGRCYMYELEDRLAMLQLNNTLHCINSARHLAYHDDIFTLSYSPPLYDNTKFDLGEYRVPPPPLPFSCTDSTIYTSSSIDFESSVFKNSAFYRSDYYSSNGNLSLSSVNDNAICRLNENDFHDDDENPRKGLLQMFCLPLNSAK